VLFANDPYVDVLIVVDALATPVLVARVDVPAALYNFTVYDDAPMTASHETSRDFAVEAVAITVIEDGAASVTAGASTGTANERRVVVPSPSSPKSFLPQHLMLVSASTTHVCV
jgi:hypothetical protein